MIQTTMKNADHISVDPQIRNALIRGLAAGILIGTVATAAYNWIVG